jgi:hypothetical protein
MALDGTLVQDICEVQEGGLTQRYCNTHELVPGGDAAFSGRRRVCLIQYPFFFICDRHGD